MTQPCLLTEQWIKSRGDMTSPRGMSTGEGCYKEERWLNSLYYKGWETPDRRPVKETTPHKWA